MNFLVSSAYESYVDTAVHEVCNSVMSKKKYIPSLKSILLLKNG